MRNNIEYGISDSNGGAGDRVTTSITDLPPTSTLALSPQAPWSQTPGMWKYALCNIPSLSALRPDARKRRIVRKYCVTLDLRCSVIDLGRREAITAPPINSGPPLGDSHSKAKYSVGDSAFRHKRVGKSFWVNPPVANDTVHNVWEPQACSELIFSDVACASEISLSFPPHRNPLQRCGW